MSIIRPEEIRPDIEAYLSGWFAKSKARQEAKGKAFQLSYSDFLQLWGRRRIRSLTQWMDDGSLYVRQRRHTKDNPNLNGYVLAPTSFAASQEKAATVTNMAITTRGQALQNCKMKKGDKHADHSREKISAGTKGVPKSDAHRGKISQTMTGMKRGPMSDADKLARSVSAKAYWDKVRAERAAKGE